MKVGRFLLQGETAQTIIQDIRLRNQSHFNAAISTTSMSYFTFDYDNGQEYSDDASIDIAGTNYIIWAHGEDWPIQHNIAGFLLINWNSGTCTYVSNSGVSPFFVFLPLVYIILVMKTPLKDIFFIKYLLTQRLPYFPTYSLASGLVITSHFIICIIVCISQITGHGSTSESYILSTGIVSTMNLWIALLPSSKSIVMNFLTDIPFERRIKYHILLTTTTLFFSWIHMTLSACFYSADFFSTTAPNLTVIPLYGFLAFVFMSIMSIFALENIRRIAYEIFLTTHYLFPLVLLFIMLHVKDPYVSYGCIPGIILHGIDILLKLYYLLNRKIGSLSSSHDITIVEVTCASAVISTPGAYYFINVPTISMLEWHPFRYRN
jgi:hypothetical protein